MTYRDLLYDVSGHTATITLNRPERLNAISGGMHASFSEVFREAGHNTHTCGAIESGASTNGRSPNGKVAKKAVARSRAKAKAR